MGGAAAAAASAAPAAAPAAATAATAATAPSGETSAEVRELKASLEKAKQQAAHWKRQHDMVKRMAKN